MSASAPIPISFRALIIVLLFLVSCNLKVSPEVSQPEAIESEQPGLLDLQLTPTVETVKHLSICMGSEPETLFIFGDDSETARSIREGIYDGPIDTIQFTREPVILEELPSLENGGIVFEPFEVRKGNLITNVDGNPVQLSEGVIYLPSGCREDTCAQTYTGEEPVLMDQMVVRYKLRPDILWSDGTALTAEDSVYAFNIASTMYPKVQSDIIAHTQAYRSLDPTTVEWRGLAGHRSSKYMRGFFIPLPKHVWGEIPPEELSTAELSGRKPMGWGPYVIDEWIPGESISMSRNPNYFRAGEGLPYFDRLVIKFTSNKEQALGALSAGGCDLLHESSLRETHISELLELQSAEDISVAFIQGTAWEHFDFGLVSNDPSLLPLFNGKEIRQAIAMCIDRQKMAGEFYPGQSAVPNSYVHPNHPLYNPQLNHYAYDPTGASVLLDSIGWVDSDGNPGTARQALGVVDIPDGTPLAFTFLTSDEPEKVRAAEIIKESLATCGVQIEVSAIPPEALFAPGPDGPLFGRRFSAAQSNWRISETPPCFLFTTEEIPGSYPDFPKSWGGANISAYSNPDYDRACKVAQTSLPGEPAYQEAHYRAQAIFNENLPAIPLYLRPDWVVMRADMCGVEVDPSAGSSLWNLENFNVGEGCRNLD